MLAGVAKICLWIFSVIATGAALRFCSTLCFCTSRFVQIQHSFSYSWALRIFNHSLKAFFEGPGEQSLTATLVCPSAPFLYAPHLPPQMLLVYRGSLHSKLKQALGEVTLDEVSVALGISTGLTYWFKGMPSLWWSLHVSDWLTGLSCSQRSLAGSFNSLLRPAGSAKCLLSASDEQRRTFHMGNLYSPASLGCIIANRLHIPAAPPGPKAW